MRTWYFYETESPGTLYDPERGTYARNVRRSAARLIGLWPTLVSETRIRRLIRVSRLHYGV